MKIISFFSKFTFICNICFIVFIFFNRMEAKRHVEATKDTVIAFPFFKDLIIILGFSAIIINLIMCVVYIITIIMRKSFILPKWLAAINFIFLLLQFYFFFS